MPGKGKRTLQPAASEESSQRGSLKRQKRQPADKAFLDDFPIQPSSGSAFVKAWFRENGRTQEAFGSLAAKLTYIGEQNQDPESELNLDKWKAEKIADIREEAKHEKMDDKERKDKEKRVTNKVANFRRDIVKQMNALITEINFFATGRTRERAGEIVADLSYARSLLGPDFKEDSINFPFKYASIYVREHFKGDYTLEAYASFVEKAREDLKDSKIKLETWKGKEKAAQRAELETKQLSNAEKVKEDWKIEIRVAKKVCNWRTRMTEEIQNCLTQVKEMDEGNRDKADKVATGLEEVLQLIRAESKFTERFPLDPPPTLVMKLLGKGRTPENYRFLAKELKTYHGWFKDKGSRIYEWEMKETEACMNNDRLSDSARKRLQKRIVSLIMNWPKLIDRQLRRCEQELSKDDSNSQTTEDFKELRELFFDLDDNHDEPQKLLKIVEARFRRVEKGKEAAKHPSWAKALEVDCFVNEFQRCQRKFNEILEANSTTEADKNRIKKLREEHKKLVTDGKDETEDSTFIDLEWNVYLRDDDEYSDFGFDEAQLIDEFDLEALITFNEQMCPS